MNREGVVNRESGKEDENRCRETQRYTDTCSSWLVFNIHSHPEVLQRHSFFNDPVKATKVPYYTYSKQHSHMTNIFYCILSFKGVISCRIRSSLTSDNSLMHYENNVNSVPS